MGRIAYATVAGLLLVAIGLEIAKRVTGFWQVAAFGFGPDLALLYGAWTFHISLDRARLWPPQRLAERLGIQAPSIHKHLRDKEELEAALISAGCEEQAELHASGGP